MDLKAISDEEMISLLNWTTENSLWDGREVRIEDFSRFSQELEGRIKLLLLNQTLSNVEIFQLSANLAYFGTEKEDQGELAEDVRELGFLPNGTLVEQAGLGKSISKFWKKHKAEIIIGAAIAAIITTVAIVAITSGGSAAGAAAVAGSASIKELKETPEGNNLGKQKALDISSPSIAFQENHEFLEKPTFVNTLPQHEMIPQRPNWNPNPEPLTFPGANQFLSENPHEFIATPNWKINQPCSKLHENIFSTPPPILQTKFVERNIPVFSSSDQLSSKSWYDWIMQSVGLGNDEPLPSAPENNFCMAFRTKGERSPNLGVGFIHGIGNVLPDAIFHAEYLSRLNEGRSIDAIYNKSNTAPIDLLEAFLINIPGESPNTAKLLQENWVEFHHKNIDNSKLKYLQVCHSQGAIHVRNALASAPKEIRDRVIVVAIAPAAVVPRELCFDSTNYACKADIVPKVEIPVSVVLDLAHREGFTHLREAIEKQDQIIWIDPHPDSKGMRHGFQDPTYLKWLKTHLQEHVENNGEYN